MYDPEEWANGRAVFSFAYFPGFGLVFVCDLFLEGVGSSSIISLRGGLSIAVLVGSLRVLSFVWVVSYILFLVVVVSRRQKRM